MQLNPQRENFKDFYGSNVDQMPKLIAEGRTPLSVEGLMKARLQYGKDLPDWVNNYFDTGDGVAYAQDGRIKIVLDSKDLREMNAQSKLRNGALILPVDHYDTLEGAEFTRKDIEKYIDKDLTKKQAKENPLLIALMRGKEFLGEVVDYIFAEGKETHGYDTMMGVYPDSASSDHVKMRAWYVYGLVNRSGVLGWSNLDYVNGRFVGVAPEVQNGESENVSPNIKTYSPADLKAMDNAIANLEKTLLPDALKPFKDLRKKL